jgi:hypothetical protein
MNSSKLMFPTAKAMGHPTTRFVRIILRSYTDMIHLPRDFSEFLQSLNSEGVDPLNPDH